MKTVLLTGGRAPATLDLARLFHAAGRRVVMAESLRWHLSRASRAVAKNFTVPWPVRDSDGYLDALAAIIKAESVDLVVPTCEEIYYIVRGRDRLPENCAVFAPPWETLRRLHSKWDFVQAAHGHGLLVPPTTLLESRDAVLELLKSGRDVVLKPVYSRFACHTVLRPRTEAAVARVHPTPGRPWVAQDFVPGRLFCTFGLAHKGRVTAHGAYPMIYTTGLGPAIAYTPMEHPAAAAWVEKLVAGEAYTGQIGVDFIERTDGALFAIECNPRATSGVHLFAATPGLADLYFEAEPPPGPPLTPRPTRPTMHGLPMIVWALRNVRSRRAAAAWLRMFVAGRDLMLAPTDLLPLLCLSLTMTPLLYRCWKHRVGPHQAATLDIEWNGP